MLSGKNRSKINGILSKYGSSDAIKQMTAGKVQEGSLLKGTISYMAIQVRDDPIENAPELISKSINIIIDAGGVVTTILSSLVVATFGFPVDDKIDGPTDCARVVSLLLNRLGHDVKIVYGLKFGMYGNLGSSVRMHYGPLLPNISSDLKALLGLSFGESKKMEISPSP